MLVPDITARMKEGNTFAGLLVKPAPSSSFSQRTRNARERQIRLRRFTAVRLWDDMIDMKGGLLSHLGE
jgi:hypothetical protein